jgi:uncharacterized protein YdaU (DUF1376 family)
MAKVDIWMPIYIGDYLADTMELEALENGAYMFLLMHYWQKCGIIGSDIEKLARVARCDEKTARFILGSYFTLENGNYKNKRADIEMKKAQSRRESAAENGKKGGRKPQNNPQETGGFSGDNPQENSSSLPPSLPLSLSPEREREKDDFTTRFEKIKSMWNNSGLKPPMRKSTFDLMQDERTAIAGTMRNYSDDDISIAIDNYMQIIASPNHCIENPYRGLIGFIRSGVEKFGPEANPWEAFKKQTPSWEKPARGTLDDRPDATTPEAIAQDLAEAAEEAMSPEDYERGLKEIQDKIRGKTFAPAG